MKKTKASLKYNFLMNLILTLSSLFFPLITFPYISRILLPDGVGKVTFATSFITYFVLISQLGIPTYGIRAVAKVRDNKEELSKTVHEVLIINIFMCIISYCLFFFLLFFIPKVRDDKMLYIILSTNILLSAIGVEWIYKGLEKYTYITVRSVIFKFLAVILMLVFVKGKGDYRIYAGISIFASSASFILNFINLHSYVDFKLLKKYKIKPHIKPVLVFFAMSCATIIYTNLDNLMLGFMTNDMEVGYYNAAVKIKTIMVSLITSLGVVLLPRASYYIEKKQYLEFKSITQKGLKFVYIISIPLCVYFIITARHGIILLSGTEFIKSIIPMRIIMPTIILIGISNIIGIQILVPLGMEKKVLKSEILGAVVDVIINFLLIPRMHSSGAAIGTLVAEIVVLLYQIYAVKEQNIDIFNNSLYKSIICTSFAALSIVWIEYVELNAFIALLLSSIIYFGIYFLLLLLTKEALMREILESLFLRFRRRKKDV